MAATRHKIRPEDLHGLKYFKALQGLIERLHFVGTQRDKAGNFELHMDQYCTLILFWFFSPIVDSLRGLQQAGELDKVQKTFCEASRQRLANYLDIFAATGGKHVLRPFAMNPTREIVAMPKVYAFDTGFVCHTRSIDSLRVDHKGPLFEHLVLDELLFEAGAEEIHHWRDKQKHEIDFVWTPRGRSPVAIECKWRASRFDPTAMHSFATLHPKAAFWLVAEDRQSWTTRRYGSIDVTECGPAQLPELMARHRRR